MYYHGQWLSHPFVYRYRNGAAMDAYFPGGPIWSRMYTAVFTIPEDLERKKKYDTKVVFSMKSGESQSEFTWDKNVADR